jgi:hypothetical protein
MKKNEVLSFASKWMELENIILIKVSQTQKDKNKCSNIIEHESYAKGKMCTEGIKEREGNLNLKVFDVPPVEELIK